MSGPKDACFGQVMPMDVEDAESAALLSEKGVALFEGSERFMSLVEKDGVGTWVGDRKETMGDRRTLLEPASVQKLRGVDPANLEDKFLVFDCRTAVKAMQPEAMPVVLYFDGPRAASEFLTSVREGAGSLMSYHAEGVRLSGVHEGGAQAHVRCAS